MKKKNFIALLATAVMTVSCGTMGTGLLTTDTLSSLGDVIVSVLGINKINENPLYGTWNYAGPGCAFTTDDLLAKAGGEMAAKKIEDKLLPHYQTLGINSGNTSFVFNQDKTFVAKVAGKTFKGNYNFDPSTGAIALQTLLISLNGYITRNTSGISLLFESQKVLTILQMLGGISGNTTISAIGEISKNYDGVRIGFDLRK